MRYILALILLALSTISNAETQLDASIFGSQMTNSHGAMISMSGGDILLYKADVVMSSNLGGVGLAVGLPYKDFKFYVGVSDVIRMRSKSGFLDVQGVPVFDPASDPQGSTTFIEARYKRLFARYSYYDIDYTLRGVRTALVPGIPTPVQLSGSEVRNTSASVLWVGFSFPLI